MKKFVAALFTVALSAATASAADLPARTYTKAPLASPAYDWTGFYLGLNAGGAWNESDPTTTTLFPAASYFAASSVPAIAAVGNQPAQVSPVARPLGTTGRSTVLCSASKPTSTISVSRDRPPVPHRIHAA